jgi:anaerobic selenocysteine-containing dehydrogenase
MVEKVITTSAIDCPDNCGIIATVKDGRLIKLEGNPEHGYTKGFLCKKGYQYIRRVYSNKRILFPLRKVKSGWKRVSWEEALDEIAERIQFFKESHGNGSIIRTS